MADKLKYSTTQPTLPGLRTDDFVLGTGDGNYGPTSTTSYLNGFTAPEGGYVVYTLGLSNTPIGWVASNDTELIDISRHLGNTTLDIKAAKIYLAGLTDTWVFNSTPNNIVTDGLIMDINGKNLTSYPESGTTAYDISGEDNPGSLQNGVGFDRDKKVFTFDNVDDRMAFTAIDYNALASSGNFTIIIEGKKTEYGTGGNDVGNSTLFQGVGNGYNGGFRIRDNNTGAPGSPFSDPHFINIGLPDINSSRAVQDTVYRPFFYAFSFTNGDEGLAFLNENISQGANNYGGGSPSYGFISYTSAGVGAWGGDIHAVKVYDRGLSLAEIRQNYYGGPIVTDGLIFAVDASNLVSYENGSTITYSLMGSYEGALTNGVGYLPNNGGTWDFDGGDDFINGTPIPTTSGDASRTTGLWFKSTANENTALWDKGSTGNFLADALYIANANGVGSSPPSNPGGVYVVFWNQDFYVPYGSTNMFDGEWHFVAYSYDSSSSSLKICIDGEFPQTVYRWNSGWTTQTSQPFSLNGNLNTPDSEYWIGRSRAALWGIGDEYGNANIAKVLHYNKALSFDEMSQNFEAHRSIFGV